MKPESGFTIIETLLYIGLFALIMIAVVGTTYNMIASTDKSQYRSLIHNEGQFVIRKFETSLDNAQSFTDTGSTLIIHFASGPDKVFTKSGSQILLDNIRLNGDIAPVTALSFTPASGTHPTEVQMTFEMKNIYYDETFTTKKLLR